MEIKPLHIQNIPALLWGPPSNHLLIAVHGNQSHKRDKVIEIAAAAAVEKGYQVLSFDLPEHGERVDEPRLCDARNCAEDLSAVMGYAKSIADKFSVFGCSIGAYFAMLAYGQERLEKAYFLSPVVDMKRLIENMMQWFDVSEARLQKEKVIETPINTLYWDYYDYVRKHPLVWHTPTAILYGEGDNLCEYPVVKAFSEERGGELTVLPGGEHFFHTESQLAAFANWLDEGLVPNLR